MLEYWNAGILEYWNMEGWNNGMLENKALLAFDPNIPPFQYSTLPIAPCAGFYKKPGMLHLMTND
jgi:hypothetical protein